ncbi:polymorphic toxin type 44 domain-containing protein [Paenibacillus macerans]|uniref:polymorphic toxin type 44 domain-containing protein n=1 Tax=Paenibacillus macerans TaxID=44252 RepID=UPI003D31E17F
MVIFLVHILITWMDDVNFAISVGGVSFDSNFDIKVASQNEITNIVFSNDLIKKRIDEGLVHPYSDPGAPPTLQAYHIASNNYDYMERYLNAIAGGILGDPNKAVTAPIEMWVGKVKPNGEWDYKAVNGYKPYNKEWTAYTRNSIEIKTSEWFGNYNYGFTGSFIFSLSTLYTGGDLVSQIKNGAPDDFSDKQAIAQGYYDKQG